MTQLNCHICKDSKPARFARKSSKAFMESQWVKVKTAQFCSSVTQIPSSKKPSNWRQRSAASSKPTNTILGFTGQSHHIVSSRQYPQTYKALSRFVPQDNRSVNPLHRRHLRIATPIANSLKLKILFLTPKEGCKSTLCPPTAFRLR